MNILLKLFVNAIIILLVAYVVPGFHVDGIWTAILVALVLGIINVTLKPILLLLTLPINIVTLGLFTFIINAFMLQVADWLIKPFRIDSFFTALIAALVIAFVHFFTHKISVPNQ